MAHVVKYECEETTKVFYLEYIRSDNMASWTEMIENAMKFYSLRNAKSTLVSIGLDKYLNAFQPDPNYPTMKSRITIAQE